MKVKIDFGEKLDVKGHENVPTFIRPNIINAKGTGGGAGVKTSINEIIYIEDSETVISVVKSAEKDNPYGEIEYLTYEASYGYSSSATVSVDESCYVLIKIHGVTGASITSNGAYQETINDDKSSTSLFRVYKVTGSASFVLTATSNDSYNSIMIFAAKIPLTYKLNGEIAYFAQGGDSVTVSVPESAIESNKKYLVMAMATCRYNDSNNAICNLGSEQPKYDDNLYSHFWAKEELGSSRGRGDCIVALCKSSAATNITAYAYDWAHEEIRCLETDL